MNNKLEKITQSNRNVTILNIVTSLLYEVIVLVYGLLVPRLILGAFGSEVNGLTSSISQFLNLITILEGGIGGVIKAALYKPLANHDDKKLSAVYNAAESFYKKLALIYVCYGIGIAIFYPIIFNVNFSWSFVFALTLIIASQSFVQYFFSINLRTLIQADRRGFVVSIISSLMQIVNAVAVILVIKIYPNVLLLKGVGLAIFILQPIIYTAYVKKHYIIDKKEPADKEALKQRWDGFGQNLAYFIHSNTDVVLLTIFGTLLDVSVYNVYFMVVAALRTLVSSVGSSISPTLGNVIAKGSEEDKNRAFDIYTFAQNAITTVCFTCGIILITPFVMVYTNGITDVDYFHPWLGYLLMLAEAVYCYRVPYVNISYIYGHFKQTAIYAYIEAGLNIVVSIIFYQFMGVEGIALGTLIAMLFRMVVNIVYTKIQLIKRPLMKAGIAYLVQGLTIISAFLITMFIEIDVNSYMSWILFGVIAFAISAVIWLIYTMIFERKIFMNTLKYVLKR